MYELRQLLRGVGFAATRALEMISPARVEMSMPFGPRAVWGPVDTPPAPAPAPAAVEDDGDDFPTGEFPLELAEQLRQSLNMPAGGVESRTPPADSAAGGHPVRKTSEVLNSALAFVQNYRLFNVSGAHLTAAGIECVDSFIDELNDRAAQFRAAGD